MKFLFSLTHIKAILKIKHTIINYIIKQTQIITCHFIAQHHRSYYIIRVVSQTDAVNKNNISNQYSFMGKLDKMKENVYT